MLGRESQTNCCQVGIGSNGMVEAGQASSPEEAKSKAEKFVRKFRASLRTQRKLLSAGPLCQSEEPLSLDVLNSCGKTQCRRYGRNKSSFLTRITGKTRRVPQVSLLRPGIPATNASWIPVT